METFEARSDIRSKIIAATPAAVFAAMSSADRIACWWGPQGFSNTIHRFEFVPGGSWLLTIELLPHAGGTEVCWRQTFDSVEHYRHLAEFVAAANEQNLERLAAEIARTNLRG